MMRRTIVVLAIGTLGGFDPSPASAQARGDIEARVAALESQLQAALDGIAAVKAELAVLAEAVPSASEEPRGVGSDPGEAFARHVQGPSPAAEQRRLTAKPDIFLQARFSTFPESEAALSDYAPNFRVARLETRWTGRLSDRIGAGVELQYHPAPDGAPDQILNDAYVEYYASQSVAIRAGQFVKPFGFDVQQPNSERESPERTMVSGYVFPGQRDRGLMVTGRLDSACALCAGLQVEAAVVNGNRFFRDSNRRLNYLVRIRKQHPAFSYGGSAQLGTQITPPDVAQVNDENVYGADAQWVIGQFGLRGEFVHANRPATLLAREPVFAPAFVEGARVRTVGASLTGLWSITPQQQAYIRLDRLAGDPVVLCPEEKDGSCKINAVNGGFRQRLENSYIGVDLQWKNRLSFNHDAVNTRMQVTWSLLF
jgi:hypothetical protein